MVVVERHIINKNHKFYKELDGLSFKAKNLYKYANYIVRQEFITTTREKEQGLRDHANYLNYYAINRKLIDDHQFDYYQLPAKVSNQVLKKLDKNWKSFFASIKDWKKNPNNYTGKPSLPQYKDKTKGRFMLEYELGSISKPLLRFGIIKLSQTNIEFKYKNNGKLLKNVRIIHRSGYYVIEVVYERIDQDLKLNKDKILGIDIGLNNLMALTSNDKGFTPLLVNGRPLKHINQYYNKYLAEFKSELPKDIFTSNKIQKLTLKRNNKINDYIHKSSKFVVDLCIKHNIGTVVIGKNIGFKDSINIGRVNNQNFVQVPIAELINKIIYKCKLVGIDVIPNEESYTSKASFLDLDELPIYKEGDDKKYKFSGRRICRGLYKSSKGIIINADTNASYNIIRKVFPNAFADGIEGYAVTPVRVKSTKEFKRFL